MTPRLIITMILDNSAAFQGEKFEKFKKAFNDCLKKFKESHVSNIDFEVIAYDEFSPKVLREYQDEDFKCAELEAFKMPFLGKSIETAIRDLNSLDEYYGEKNVPIYKPWFFVITNAYSFDDVDDGVRAMKEYFTTHKVLYMPFILSQRKIPANVEPLAKIKSFMRIKENAYEEFFNWFFEMVTKRASTSPDQAVKFDRADFEGWAII